MTIAYISMTLMLVAGMVLLFGILLIAPAVDKVVPDRANLELYLSLVMYTTCLIGLGVNLNVFAFQSMTREKSRGNIESLLATPLNVQNIWMAKGLAIFLPGLVIGEILTFIVLISGLQGGADAKALFCTILASPLPFSISQTPYNEIVPFSMTLFMNSLLLLVPFPLFLFPVRYAWRLCHLKGPLS